MINKNCKFLLLVLLSPIYFIICFKPTNNKREKIVGVVNVQQDIEVPELYSMPVDIVELPILEETIEEETTTIAETDITPTQENIEETNENNEYRYFLSDSDKNLLAVIVMAEAEGEPFEGKIAVAQVVLYRSLKYDCSISDVVYAHNQFSSVGTYRMNLQPSDDCYLAVDTVLKGEWVLSDDIEYFYNPNAGISTWFENNLTYKGTIGKHKFYSN